MGSSPLHPHPEWLLDWGTVYYPVPISESPAKLERTEDSSEDSRVWRTLERAEGFEFESQISHSIPVVLSFVNGGKNPLPHRPVMRLKWENE